jgi:hypothetical protein
VALHDLFHAYRIEELLLRLEWATEWRSFDRERQHAVFGGRDEALP